MRYFSLTIAALLIVSLALVGCKKPTTPATTNVTGSDGARRISIDDARAAVAQGTALIIDVRDVNSYKARHIQGSINIPFSEIAGRVNELPKDKLAVLYCS